MAPAGFAGTNNPRQLRAVHALLSADVGREDLDRIIGASNSPEVVRRLRAKGLDVQCFMVAGKDRDGRSVAHGLYSMTDEGKRRVCEWLAGSGKSINDMLAKAGPPT